MLLRLQDLPPNITCHCLIFVCEEDNSLSSKLYGGCFCICCVSFVFHGDMFEISVVVTADN